MSLSYSSDCSDLSDGETSYSLEDLQKMGIIENKVAEWIKENPLTEDDALLCLEYCDQNIGNRGNEIQAALTGNGNGGTLVTSTVFKFPTRNDVYFARKRIMETHTWAFYNPFGITVSGHLFNQPGQWVPLPQAQTIGTKVIQFLSDSKFTLENFEFFMF
uniref:Uncharacterized protein n=1 Tax=Panagrolaimus davidi TaxID=227884 RepID=A0A914Q5L4_9BILA